MTDRIKAHAHEYRAQASSLEWLPAQAPDLVERDTGRLCSCNWCGSMHPAEVAAALRAGAKLDAADRKYGWPHKYYVRDIPNPHAGMLEVRSWASLKDDRFPREVREPRFDQSTGARIEDHVRYTEAPKPAGKLTHGKFYTEHLQDATPEDRDVIERAMGLRFVFEDGPQGAVRWSRYDQEVAG